MCILDLSKVLMFEFHYDYIKNKYGNNSRLLLFTDTDSLMFEIKTENAYEDFSKDKEMFDFINYSAKSKYSNKLVVGKMKNKTGGAVIKEFVGLKPKTYSFLVNGCNVVATISHDEYKDVLLYKKCLRHSLNRIQSKT